MSAADRGRRLQDLIRAAQPEVLARNSRISRRSAVVGSPDSSPWSTSCWRTFFRSVSGCVPKSWAICAIGRSLSSANLTPLATSSSGYFFRDGGWDVAEAAPEVAIGLLTVNR